MSLLTVQNSQSIVFNVLNRALIYSNPSLFCLSKPVFIINVVFLVPFLPSLRSSFIPDAFDNWIFSAKPPRTTRYPQVLPLVPDVLDMEPDTQQKATQTRARTPSSRFILTTRLSVALFLLKPHQFLKRSCSWPAS